MARTRKETLLPISERPAPEGPTWTDEAAFLREAGAQSLKTESTYRSGLRLFADWLQHFRRAGYAKTEPWPLRPDRLTTDIILDYRNWLLANRSRATVTTYMAAVAGYLNFLDGYDRLPESVQLGKLQRQMARRQVERNQAENVIDLDIARQDIPRIIAYYDALPLPPENDTYNRRLSLLRDRAVVKMLYSTAARISEVVALNRANVGHGRAAYATIVGKGNKGRTLHIRGYAREAVVTYLAERTDTNPALFVSHSRNSSSARLSITSVHKVVKRAVHAEHLHESLSAHDFRHYRATQLLRAGMPLEVVQEFLGHADVTTTRNIYAPVLGVQVVTEWLDNLDVTPKEALNDSSTSLLPDERIATLLDRE
ncbi:tyrosine-type recombinase/integrase [Promineifilum sp.]|uniref:tyrosine-type recombinase/integrase n=1 Tax=Promineifilum sp. TaxID=2664178 RepID=UPI0035B3157E